MIRIVDCGSSGNTKTFGTQENLLIDRDIYRRLQKIPAVKIGLSSEDSGVTLSYFFDEMQKINDNILTNVSAIKVDEFFGSLGVTQYYPHQDNSYTGDLKWLVS